jgi:hypothetical protein
MVRNYREPWRPDLQLPKRNQSFEICGTGEETERREFRKPDSSSPPARR